MWEEGESPRVSPLAAAPCSLAAEPGRPGAPLAVAPISSSHMPATPPAMLLLTQGSQGQSLQR